MATTSPRGASRSTRRPSPGATLLVMVRHGTTPTTGKVLPGIAKGLHLADKGRAEAQAVAHRLSGLAKVEALYASPLGRARETAAPLAPRLNLPGSIAQGLMGCDVRGRTRAPLRAVATR